VINLRTISNSERLLKVREILFKATDEVNEIAMDQLIEKLREMFGDGYEVNARRRIYPLSLRTLRQMKKSWIFLTRTIFKQGRKSFTIIGNRLK
jgi:hypothetical protein